GDKREQENAENKKTYDHDCVDALTRIAIKSLSNPSDFSKHGIYGACVQKPVFHFRNTDPLLLHTVTVPDGNRFIRQRLMVYGYAKGGTDGILSAIAFSNGVFLFVETTKVIFEIIHDCLRLLRETV